MKKLLTVLLFLCLCVCGTFASPESDMKAIGLNGVFPSSYRLIGDYSSPEEYDYHYHFEVKASSNPANDRFTYFNQVISAVLRSYPDATTYNVFFDEVPLKRFTSSPDSEYTYTFMFMDGDYNVEFSIYDDNYWDESVHNYWIDVVGYEPWSYDDYNYDYDWDSDYDYDWDSYYDYDWDSDYDYDWDSDYDYDWDSDYEDSFDWGSWFSTDEWDYDDSSWGMDYDWDYEDDEDYGDSLGDSIEALLDLMNMDASAIDAYATSLGLRVTRTGGDVVLTDPIEETVITLKKNGSLTILEGDELTTVETTWPTNSMLAKLLPEPKNMEVSMAIYTDDMLSVIFSEYTTIEQARAYGESLKGKFPIDQQLEDTAFLGMSIYSLEGQNADGWRMELVHGFGACAIAIEKR